MVVTAVRGEMMGAAETPTGAAVTSSLSSTRRILTSRGPASLLARLLPRLLGVADGMSDGSSEPSSTPVGEPSSSSSSPDLST